MRSMAHVSILSMALCFHAFSCLFGLLGPMCAYVVKMYRCMFRCVHVASLARSKLHLHVEVVAFSQSMRPAGLMLDVPAWCPVEFCRWLPFSCRCDMLVCACKHLFSHASTHACRHVYIHRILHTYVGCFCFQKTTWNRPKTNKDNMQAHKRTRQIIRHQDIGQRSKEVAKMQHQTPKKQHSTQTNTTHNQHKQATQGPPMLFRLAR